jgi:hypothetical protein
VARNAPYAGGYTTEHYGRPSRRTHAIQVEINRALYMNETTREPTEGLARLKADIESVTARLVADRLDRIALSRAGSRSVSVRICRGNPLQIARTAGSAGGEIAAEPGAARW